MPALQRARRAAVQERERLCLIWRVEQQPDGPVQGGLMLIGQLQIVAAGVEHLLAQRALTEERVPVSTRPARDMGGTSAGAAVQFRRLVTGRGARFVGQHTAMRVTKGGEGTGRTSTGCVLPSAALRFAINCDTMESRDRLGGRGVLGEIGGQGRGQRMRIQFGEQALQGGFTGLLAARKAELTQLGYRLPRAPFRHGYTESCWAKSALTTTLRIAAKG
jgi:hypothetical protein